MTPDFDALRCPLFHLDFYKAGHVFQYPPKTQRVYSNFTPRSNKLNNLSGELGERYKEGIVFFGLQAYILQRLCEDWKIHFFDQPRDELVGMYKEFLDSTLGGDNDVSHVHQLHDLGYLPIRIKALPEGTLVPYGVPALTIENTVDEAFWLVNYLETTLSANIWKPCTSATTARWYRRTWDFWKGEAGIKDDPAALFRCHDFSYRGMGGEEDAAMSGAGHLTSWLGTDTVPAIFWLQKYYFPEKDALIGASVPATEHSVMCAGTKEDELATFERLLDTYPTGILSIVSDSWDFWKVCTEYLPHLRERILSRDGKLVIRPDSGNPADIICGTNLAPAGSPESIGAAGLLAKTFGGTMNESGLLQLDPHIGLIYGDSITPHRCEDILSRLVNDNRIAPDFLVLGIGSYTYTHVTRDTHGFAVKATWTKVDGEDRPIFKDPVTDDGAKKSLKGRLSVRRDDYGKLVVFDNIQHGEVSMKEELVTVFEDGGLLYLNTLKDIRKRVEDSL